MSQKELNAWVMVVSAILVSGWVAVEAMGSGLAATAQAAAWKMLWAIGYTIAFNIVAVIVGTIVVSIVRREEVRDERADERDVLVSGMAMRNGYFVLSVGVGLTLVAWAVGLDVVTIPYVLFGISMLAGGIFAASQIVYYRSI